MNESEVQTTSEELRRATEQYRAITKSYLKERGAKRKALRGELEKKKAAEHSLKLRLVDLKIIEIKEELNSTAVEARKHKRFVEHLDALRKLQAKLLSRLDHDEWMEFTRSVWDFKSMESNVKTSLHPAQFSARLPYRLIKMYSYVGEVVLDPFMGIGTTLIEACKLKRRSVGIDINPEFVRFAEGSIQKNCEFDKDYRPVVGLGDARNLRQILPEDQSIDLIVTHPPYWNAVKISNLPNDLSNFSNGEYDKFIGEMKKAFIEMKRVLKDDRILAVVTGDVLRKVHGITQLFPIHSDYIQMIRGLGFVVWDTFIYEIKIRKSGGKPMMGSYPFPHKLFSEFAHNYVLVFRKLNDV